MSRSLLAQTGVLAILWLGACGSDFTSGEGGGGTAPGGSGGTTSSGSGGSTSGTGGSGGCPPDTMAIPPIPDGWSGPAKFAESDALAELPSCGDHEQLDLHDGLDFEAPFCDCDCGEPVCEATIGYYNNNTCTGTPASSQVISTGCSSVSGGSGNAAKWASTPECAPQETAEIPPPTWAVHLRLCAVFDVESPEESCAPKPTAPFEPPLCIVTEGAGQTCPPGYDEGMERYYDFSDSRDCIPECACAAGTVDCNDSVHTHSATNCQGGTMSPWTEDNCVTSVSFPAVSYVAVAHSGSCVATAVQTAGTVTATNPFTVCCMPH